MFLTHTDHDQTITLHVPFGAQRIVQSDKTGQTALKPLGGTLPKGTFPTGYQLPDGRTVRVVADAPERCEPVPAPGPWLVERYTPQVVGALRVWAAFLTSSVVTTQRLLALLGEVLEQADPADWPTVIERTNRALFTDAEPTDTEVLRGRAQRAGLLDAADPDQASADAALNLLRTGDTAGLVSALAGLTPKVKGRLLLEVAHDATMHDRFLAALRMLNEMREAAPRD